MVRPEANGARHGRVCRERRLVFLDPLLRDGRPVSRRGSRDVVRAPLSRLKRISIPALVAGKGGLLGTDKRQA